MAKKQILYVQTSGVGTPKRLYAPFVLAMTAKAMDGIGWLADAAAAAEPP